MLNNSGGTERFFSPRSALFDLSGLSDTVPSPCPPHFPEAPASSLRRGGKTLPLPRSEGGPSEPELCPTFHPRLNPLLRPRLPLLLILLQFLHHHPRRRRSQLAGDAGPDVDHRAAAPAAAKILSHIV